MPLAPASSMVPAMAGLERLLVVAELAVGKNLDVDAPRDEFLQGFLEPDRGDVAGMDLIRGMGQPHADRLFARARYEALQWSQLQLR